jgi:hypothetical protein
MSMPGVIEIPYEFTGRCDKASGRLAAKNFIHAHALTRGQGGSALKRLYSNLCTLPAPHFRTESMAGPLQGTAMRLQLKKRYQPQDKNIPCFIRDLHILEDGRIICLSQIDKRLMHVDFDDDPMPTNAPQDILSTTRNRSGFMVLAADGHALYTLEDAFRLHSTCNLDALNLTPQATHVDTTDTGLVLTDLAAKRIVFLDDSLHFVSDLSLNHLAIMKRGSGFHEGVLVFETFPGKRDYGELLWVGPSGELFTLLGGLWQPTSAKCHDEKVLVCDITGLHILTIDGLAVVERRFVPWEQMLRAVDLDRGYGFEVLKRGASLFVVFIRYIPGIPESLSYCLAEFQEIVSDNPGAH